MRILMMLRAGSTDWPSARLTLHSVVEPYYLFQDAGAEVVVVSSLGGHPWFSGARKRSVRAIALLNRFHDDRLARDTISDTLRFSQICPEDFDGGICLGALDDDAAPDDAAATLEIIATLLAAGKPVAVVPSDLLHASQRPLEGLLIIGDRARSPSRAAKALLAALNVGIT